jgi:hypothetical protein
MFLIEVLNRILNLSVERRAGLTRSSWNFAFDYCTVLYQSTVTEVLPRLNVQMFQDSWHIMSSRSMSLK